MELTWKTSQPVKHAAGQIAFAVEAGQSLKIETSPQGEEVLNVECPAGKAWTVHVSVFVEEGDQ